MTQFGGILAGWPGKTYEELCRDADFNRFFSQTKLKRMPEGGGSYLKNKASAIEVQLSDKRSGYVLHTISLYSASYFELWKTRGVPKPYPSFQGQLPVGLSFDLSKLQVRQMPGFPQRSYPAEPRSYEADGFSPPTDIYFFDPINLCIRYNHDELSIRDISLFVPALAQ